MPVHQLVRLTPRPPTKPSSQQATEPPVHHSACLPNHPLTAMLAHHSTRPQFPGPTCLPSRLSYPTPRQPFTPPAQHTSSPQARLLVSHTSDPARQPTQSPTPTPTRAQHYARHSLRLSAPRLSLKRPTITFCDYPPALPISLPAHC